MEESDETAHEGLEMGLITQVGEMELRNPDEIPGSVDKSHESLGILENSFWNPMWHFMILLCLTQAIRGAYHFVGRYMYFYDFVHLLKVLKIF